MNMGEGLRIENLRYAQAVAATGSFSQAARLHGVTQPALSNGVARLEVGLGCRLFDRSARGTTLTTYGRQLLPMIGSALDALDAVTTQAERFRSRTGAELRVGVSLLIGAPLIARLFAAACQLENPRTLVLREDDLDVLHHELAGGGLDLILIPALDLPGEFRRSHLDSEPVVLVRRHGPGESMGEGLELAEVTSSPFLLVPDRCGLTTFTRQLFGQYGATLEAYAGEAGSYRTLEQWAQLGLGSAILPASKVTVPARPLVHHGTPVQLHYEALWRRDGSPLERTLADLVDTLAPETPPPNDAPAHRG